MKKKLMCFLLALMLIPAGFLLSACGQPDFEIELDYSEAKTEYYVGEEFSYDGLVVKRVEDDESLIVTKYIVNHQNFDNTTAGKYTITVEYKSKTASYEVTVVDKKELSLDTTNVKTAYMVGEDFMSTGLVVKYIVNGESTTLSSNDYMLDCSLFNKTTAGTYNIKVMYNNIIETFPVTVYDEESIIELLASALDNEDEIESVYMTCDSNNHDAPIIEYMRLDIFEGYYKSIWRNSQPELYYWYVPEEYTAYIIEDYAIEEEYREDRFIKVTASSREEYDNYFGRVPKAAYVLFQCRDANMNLNIENIYNISISCLDTNDISVNFTYIDADLTYTISVIIDNNTLVVKNVYQVIENPSGIYSYEYTYSTEIIEFDIPAIPTDITWEEIAWDEYFDY